MKASVEKTTDVERSMYVDLPWKCTVTTPNGGMSVIFCGDEEEAMRFSAALDGAGSEREARTKDVSIRCGVTNIDGYELSAWYRAFLGSKHVINREIDESLGRNQSMWKPQWVAKRTKKIVEAPDEVSEERWTEIVLDAAGQAIHFVRLMYIDLPGGVWEVRCLLAEEKKGVQS